MTRTIKIVLPEPAGTRLDEVAQATGEAVATVAARLVKEQLADPQPSDRSRQPRGQRAAAPAWLEPHNDIAGWRASTWGAIVALHLRYPQQLAGVQDGWWEHPAQRETLAALAAWRAEVDYHGDDPRDELLFHAQLNDYAEALRNQARGVAKAWQPGAPPSEWASQ
jgi:hypothetical protein